MTTSAPSASPKWPREWSFLAAFLLALTYLVTSILIARHRLFWYDEIYTVVFSRLPDLAAIGRTLTAHSADSMPPTYYMLVRMFERLPMPFEVSARLPSALAMAVGMLITFDCARRLTDGLHGLIALAVLSCSLLPYYGYEARPYALYFMFASLALWLWLHTSNTSKAAALLFGIAVFLAITVHYYAILCLVPYTAWEVWNWGTRPAPSSKLIAGFVAVVCAGAIFSKQILSLHRLFSPVFWAPPALNTLANIFNDLFPHALFLLVGIMVLAALVGPKKKAALVTVMQPSEQLCWFFALIPVAGYVLAKVGTNAFYNRYFMCLLPGIAVAFSCLLWRQFKGSRWISFGALLLLAAPSLGKQLDLVMHPSHVRPLAVTLQAEPERLNAISELENRLPPAKNRIVFPAGNLVAQPAYYYSRHPERYALLLGTGLDSLQLQPPWAAIGSPIQYWTLDDLISNAKQVTLIEPLTTTIQELERAGFKTTKTNYNGIQLVTVD